MTLDDFIKLVRETSRPFTVYIVAVAFALGLFLGVTVDKLGLAVGLLGFHGYLRTQDKKTEALATTQGT